MSSKILTRDILYSFRLIRLSNLTSLGSGRIISGREGFIPRTTRIRNSTYGPFPLMRIRQDSWKNGSSRFTDFLTKEEFSHIFWRFLCWNEPFRDNEIFLYYFFGLWKIYLSRIRIPDSWIRIFLRIEIHEAKMLRIQQIRIRILSVKCVYYLYWDFSHFHKIIRQNKYITFKTEKPRLRNLHPWLNRYLGI